MLDVVYETGTGSCDTSAAISRGRLTVKLSRVKRYLDAAALKVTTVPHNAKETSNV
jgi:hypothetical protein